jgi:hypothetical protein
MGYLDNSSVTVDAILTKKGRELLSLGKDEFKITQFALSDDEVDYDLWNPAHPLGSNYYGIIIENMPLVEAVPDESQIMKYKLVTLPKKTSRIPVITIGQSQVTFTAGGDSTVIKPNTSNFQNGNATLGYTAILSNSDVCDLRVAAGGEVRAGVSPSTPRFIGDNEAAQSVAVTGFQFELIAKDQPLAEATDTLTLIGNETGGRKTVNITVKQMQTFTAPNVPIESNPRRTFR